MAIVALRQPLLGGATAGKWDRFGTFGQKDQGDGPFEFSPVTLGQMVDNFARYNRGRRLGMDYEHQVIFSAQNGKPAPNLAYYNGMALIEGGKVTAFHAQQADVLPPDPAVLLSQIREKYPDESDPDGGWIYRCEVTPLGMELLPNYEQISPLVNMEAKDEQGNPIGARLLNVSAVNVAFQDRTVINLAALGFGDSSLHTPEPVKTKGAKMAEEKKDEKEGGSSSLRSECMKMYGLSDEDSEDALYGAIKGSRMSEGGGDKKDDEEEDKKEKPEAMAAAPAEMPAAMSAIKSRLDEEAKRNTANEAELAVLRQERQIRKAGEWRSFSAMFLAEEPAEKFLKEHGGDHDKATRALSALDLPRRTGLSQRLTQDGQPVGADAIQAGSAVEQVAGLKIIGRGLSAMSQTILAKGEAKTLREAQILAARRAPHLYSR